MKKILSILMLSVLISSCEKGAIKSDFDKSLSVWQEFKKSVNNNYSYTVKTESWAGFGDSTIISVQNGIVTGRKYASYVIDSQTGQKNPTGSWTETKADLNSHDSGAQTITIDAIYEKASSEWLKINKNDNTIHFETKNQGIISTCGYTNKNCKDDCFVGVVISNIKGE
jgi:hypothetical protein